MRSLCFQDIELFGSEKKNDHQQNLPDGRFYLGNGFNDYFTITFVT